jgi:hypothetical protein
LAVHIQIKGKLKAFLKNTLKKKKKAGELLSLSRNQLKIITDSTGHCHLKRHLFKLGLVNSPECGICKQAPKIAPHIPFACEVLAKL